MVHSATKYLNGHSDMVGGVAVVGDNQELADQLDVPAERGRRDRGTVRQLPGPARAEDAASADGAALRKMPLSWPPGWSSIPQWSGCIYPGLASHPQHDLAARQMNGFGGMITMFLKGDLDRPARFLENCHFFALAESLGGVESLIEHPAIMTHGSKPHPAIGDSLVRLSVGVEDYRDLQSDLDQALSLIK